MMRTSDKHKFAGISSFKGFRVEKDRLVRKRLNIEERIDLSYRMLSKMVSVSAQIITLAKDILIPGISEFLKRWLNKNVNTAGSGENTTDANP